MNKWLTIVAPFCVGRNLAVQKAILVRRRVFPRAKHATPHQPSSISITCIIMSVDYKIAAIASIVAVSLDAKVVLWLSLDI